MVSNLAHLKETLKNRHGFAYVAKVISRKKDTGKKRKIHAFELITDVNDLDNFIGRNLHYCLNHEARLMINPNPKSLKEIVLRSARRRIDLLLEESSKPFSYLSVIDKIEPKKKDEVVIIDVDSRDIELLYHAMWLIPDMYNNILSVLDSPNGFHVLVKRCDLRELKSKNLQKVEILTNSYTNLYTVL